MKKSNRAYIELDYLFNEIHNSIWSELINGEIIEQNNIKSFRRQL